MPAGLFPCGSQHGTQSFLVLNHNIILTWSIWFIDDFLLSYWIMENSNLWLQNWEYQILIHRTHSTVLIFTLETLRRRTYPKKSHHAMLTSSILGVCVILQLNFILVTAYEVLYCLYRCWNTLQPLKYSLKKIFPNCFFISNHTVLLQTYIW